MKILVAEDSPMYQRLIAGYLTRWEFDFELVYDGDTAWKRLKEPDGPMLALLDWGLPGMEGIEVCRNIRNCDVRERYIYTVLLTGKTDKKDLVEAMNAGADDYLVKPFDAPELRARLLAGKRILDLHRELISAQDSLRFAATHDFLTRLCNRAEILSFLERELSRASREKTQVGIVLVDVDHFKAVNDSLGHSSGDLALQEVARRLRSQLRDYDGIGRYGGEEFLLVLPGCNLSATLSRAEQIRHFVSKEPVIFDATKCTITVSMGVTVATGKQIDPATLLRNADVALYRAKNSGRNCVQPSLAESII
jgi:two-component system, cell cycle response regulator